jgi:hypothetical protein
VNHVTIAAIDTVVLVNAFEIPKLADYVNLIASRHRPSPDLWTQL